MITRDKEKSPFLSLEISQNRLLKHSTTKGKQKTSNPGERRKSIF